MNDTKWISVVYFTLKFAANVCEERHRLVLHASGKISHELEDQDATGTKRWSSVRADSTDAKELGLQAYVLALAFRALKGEGSCDVGAVKP